ncbi:hypothetical protein ACG83_17125 [Frankia sp. R43]|uniref:recombinase family protein n=1 Tax=Frankia sp. R43 TaxID=269536 RepID=UPI0006CA02C8|nr:recombinase family protein [Frankia sp. R43]KPM55057.1 hypothetical protein ACG83_17125 [Frankia sp. R43]
MSASTVRDAPEPRSIDSAESAYGYERLSRDREGKKRKVTEQRADIDEHGPLLGYNLVQHFDDNSVSASKYDIDRPGFEALCEALRTTSVRNVLVTEVTRISRQDESGGAFMGIMTRAKGKVVKIPEGIIYDFSTSHGRDQFRQALGDAIRESDKISERVRKAQKKLREKKRWTGGPAPFAYKKDVYPELVDGRYETRIRWVVEESEAEHVREMCAAILRGESLSMISERLNQAGVKPRRSKYWQYSSVSAITQNPRICGLYALQVDGVWEVPDVQPEEQQFPPIVDYATWNAVRLNLKARGQKPERTTAHDAVTETAGLFRCGACQQTLFRHAANSDSVSSFIRHPGPGRSRPCPAGHKLSASYDETWDYVAGLIDRFILAAPLMRRTAEVRDFDDELSRVERDLQELNTALDAGEITIRLAGVREKALLEKEREIKLAREKARAGNRPVNNFGIAATWRNLPLTELRAIIFGVFKHIEITPGIQGRDPWDRSRFTPHFTEEMSPALNDMLIGSAPGWETVSAWLRAMKDDPDAPKDAAGALQLSQAMVSKLLFWARAAEKNGLEDFFRTPTWSQWVLKPRTPADSEDMNYLDVPTDLSPFD